jgi:hypothetical protein
MCAVQIAVQLLWLSFRKRFEISFTFVFKIHESSLISCLDFYSFNVLDTAVFCGDASKAQEETKNQYLFPIQKIILLTIHVNGAGKKGK